MRQARRSDNPSRKDRVFIHAGGNEARSAVCRKIGL
jgi:hypothetical protein